MEGSKEELVIKQDGKRFRFNVYIYRRSSGTGDASELYRNLWLVETREYKKSPVDAKLGKMESEYLIF